MSKSFEKLRKLLEEMFQLNQAELDFGIYRIMNYKRREIEKFLDKDLLPQVRGELEKYISVKQESLIEEMDDLKKTLDATGVVYEQSAKYVALKSQIENGLSVEQAESEVYSHLANFFGRYYDNGDFISARRYKKGVYAIPYEGEEVKLHFANADQYYIKTTEYFRDYSFKLPCGKIVHFKLVEANTEKDNNKAPKGKERRFVIYKEEPFKIKDGELYIHFEYKVDNKKQDKLIAEALDLIKTHIKVSSDYAPFIEIFTQSPTEKNPNRTLIEKHLNDYTARNTFDYFIHKDLGGFLRRELDFYLKNEVMFLDDLNTENERRVEEYITKIKVIKSIGHKIIEFLAQIEDFQKKLWLKKKFIVQSDYCITLDKVDESFYPEIIDNEKQIEEWKKLFAIDEIEDYVEPLTIKFLKENPYLVLDTAFYDENFKEKLIESIDNIDENTDGLLIHSENFQTLNLLQEKYKTQIECCYIDPPYNTMSSEILYKNNYKHSSWLSLMNDRLMLSKKLLKKDGIITVAIDDYEVNKLWELMTNIFGYSNHLGTIVIRNNPKGRMTSRKVSLTHEYTLIFGNSEDSYVKKLPVDPRDKTHNYKQDENGEWYLPVNLRKQGVDSEAEKPDGSLSERYFPIYYDPLSGKISSLEKLSIKILPIDSSGNKRIWRRGKDVIDEMYKKGQLWVQETKQGLQVYFKFTGGLDGKLVQSIWSDPRCSASDHGTKILDNLLGCREVFSYPKAPYAVEQNILTMSNNKLTTVLDFFAGSGTTAHAVINLNREDEGNRKYILVEMGEYFDTVLKPRIQKVIYSKDWKDGKPVDREGSSHIFKYIKLESYEDTLNNLTIEIDSHGQKVIEQHDNIREQYMLSYMLDKETEGSMSLLNIDSFKNPFHYKLNIANGLETKETVVDLVETFNYLIGLTVHSISAKMYVDAESVRDEKRPGKVKLNVREYGRGEYVFKEVEGILRTGEKVLIIWRNMTDDIAKDNAVLDAYFEKKRYNTRDFEYDRIYVNGDNNLFNLRLADETWKVVLIEEEFKKKMFDVQEL